MSNEREKAKIVMGELIGEKTRVTNSKDKGKIGIEGKIVDETLNTLTIETKEKKEKKIPKKTSTFTFKKNNQKIKGKEIAYRPEDRIKKNWRKYDGVFR